MGLLDNQVDREYYQGSDHGNYQFISLDDIITQFQIAYVGEDKIISKMKRVDIAFHAQRALQELSFDTFKSTKAHEIELPPSLIMTLPRDYVNYTKVSTVDSAGIKHLLYPTSATSNPFHIKQLDDGLYSFIKGEQLIKNGKFTDSLTYPWYTVPASANISGAWGNTDTTATFTLANGSLSQIRWKYDSVGIVDGKLTFSSHWNNDRGVLGWGRKYGSWQKIDTSNYDLIDLSATGTSAAVIEDNTKVACDAGILRLGISSKDPYMINGNPFGSTPFGIGLATANKSIQEKEHLDLGYIEWKDGATSSRTLEDVDVSAYREVWIWVQSHAPWKAHAASSDAAAIFTASYDNSGEEAVWSVNGFTPTGWSNLDAQGVEIPVGKVALGTPAVGQPLIARYQDTESGVWVEIPGLDPVPNNVTFQDPSINSIDNISVTSSSIPLSLRGTADGKSTAQSNYNSSTPSENNNNNYQNDIYWPMDGSRIGLDPSHAQANGSFYIDNRLGKINFSSNISGKTVILDYISDSLGTDREMQVHKFAEEAMYKWMAHAILATRTNVQEYIINRFKKERFAAVRTAKLRLSNIKLEEITQILRGKSKQIKH